MNTQTKPQPGSAVLKDLNEKSKVAEFISGSNTTTVYMVNPGDVFHGFGGSRHALSPKKTASMIVRSLGPMGLNDCEYDINDKAVWQSLMKVARACPPVQG
jgi:hypothetical protein